MGTTYSIKIASASVDTFLIKKQVESSLKEVNRQMSTYIPSSEISKLNNAEKLEPVEVSKWFYKVLTYSLSVAEKTGGSYDPTLGTLINLWGFGPSGIRKVPEKEKIEEALAVVGFDKLSLIQLKGKNIVKKSLDEVYVDLSSSAKGFGVDVLSELLQKEGVSNYLVEIGGELKASGDKFGKPWKVAVEKPSSKGRSLQRILHLQDMAIATSGDYRNFFNAGNKKYSHTLDVKTGEPVQHKLVSVSVLDKDCMKADAWATALMSQGPEKAISTAKKENLAAYLIFEDAKNDLKVFESTAFLSLTELTKK